MIRNMFFGAAKSSKYRPKEILYTSYGSPIALVIGSYASGGAEPWNIRGRRIWIAVGLATFRAESLPWCSSITTSSPAKDCSTTIANYPTVSYPSWALASTNTGPDASGGSVVSIQSTEAHMDDCFKAVMDTTALVTSEQQTDAILNYNSNMKAAKWCRSLQIADLGAMDLPSIDVLMRIYQARTLIDALDPTANSVPKHKLENWGFDSLNGKCVLSAMQRAKDTAWTIDNNGTVAYKFKSYGFGVIPVKEIEAE